MRALLLLLPLLLTFALPAGAAAMLDDHFKGVQTTLPNGESKLYPDPKVWAFTFWPGAKWPDSYGNGTNWLESNGECQVYLSPFTARAKTGIVPPGLRYDPFTIQPDGLHIKATVLTRPQQGAYNIGAFRRFGSGMILSRQSFTYGKIRVVAKLPSARGSWPAIWLLADSHQWPPEIAMLEGMAWGRHATQVHSGMLVPKTDNKKDNLSQWYDVGVDPSKDFHEYGLDWNKDTITVTFDGKPLWTHATPPSMHQPMYLIVNFAVGGKWVYNELGVGETDSRTMERLTAGADAIQGDYPAEMIVKSVKIEAPAGDQP